MRTWPTPLKARGIALGALLRRDLSAGRRGATVASARLVVVALSGTIAIVALLNARELYGEPQVAGGVGFLLAWLLAAFSLAMLPVLSLQAMRQDRESGKLDLLLLAGLSPRTLAFGRWFSTFLLLQSLLLDALPASAAFLFFGTPTVEEFGWAVLAITGWNASLAGLAVYLSAVIRRAGPCLFFSLLAVVLLVSASTWDIVRAGQNSSFDGLAPTPPLLLAELTFSRLGIGQGHGVDFLRHLQGLAASLGIGALFALLAGERLRARARPPAARRARRWGWARLGAVGAPGPVRERPLSWLLHRGAPATRPLWLALVLPFPMITMAIGFELFRRSGRTSLDWADMLEPSILVTFACLHWVFALLLAMIASALQVSRLRERKEWDSVLATGRSGRAIVLDLMAGPGRAAAVGACLSAMLLTTAWLLDPDLDSAAGLLALGALVAVGGSCLFALGLGLISGLTARSQAGSLGLATLLVVAALVLGTIAAALFEDSDLARGLDSRSRLAAVAISLCVGLPLQLWLLDRSRHRPGTARLFFELLLCACLVMPPLVVGLSAAGELSAALFMTGIAAAILGLPLVASLLRRPNLWLGRTG